MSKRKAEEAMGHGEAEENTAGQDYKRARSANTGEGSSGVSLLSGMGRTSYHHGAGMGGDNAPAVSPEDVKQAVLDLLQYVEGKYGEGMPFLLQLEELRTVVGPNVPIKDAVNRALKSHNLQVLGQSAKGAMVQLVDTETANRLQELTSVEVLVFNQIARSKGDGMWRKDIKEHCKLREGELNKSIKTLENKKLIKSVIARKSSSQQRRRYMLFHAEPSARVTGGNLFNAEGTLDEVLIRKLRKQTHRAIAKSGARGMTQAEVGKVLSSENKREFEEHEVGRVLSSLQLEYEVCNTNDSRFQLAHTMHEGAFAKIPCGTCPVIAQCGAGNLVNPSTCTYLTQWIEGAF